MNMQSSLQFIADDDADEERALDLLIDAVQDDECPMLVGVLWQNGAINIIGFIAAGVDDIVYFFLRYLQKHGVAGEFEHKESFRL
jgi:hypothetical protein